MKCQLADKSQIDHVENKRKDISIVKKKKEEYLSPKFKNSTALPYYKNRVGERLYILVVINDHLPW